VNVWNGIEGYPEDRGAVVATIGNYDGVHRGHRVILDGIVAEARRGGLPSLLITFEPHPLAVVAPERRPALLQTRRQKLDCLEQAGLDDVLILTFDGALAELEGEAFFADLLCAHVELAAVQVGENFRFGHRRAGDLELLREIGSRQGFDVVGVPPVRQGDDTVSSSAIRAAVAAGDVERAARLLGRPFSLTGEVVRGDGRGADLDFPTANLEVENEVLPTGGVYVSETRVLAGRYPSMTNVGVRPTFGGREVRVETHLLDFSDDLYGERLELDLLARIRDEQRFDGPGELADQLARDRAAAEAYFHNLHLRAP
jgi:riboflavin kinase/FMN adenylyltransferase